LEAAVQNLGRSDGALANWLRADLGNSEGVLAKWLALAPLSMNSSDPIIPFESVEEELEALRARCHRAETELAKFQEDIWSITEVQQALEAVSRTGSEFVIHMDHKIRTTLSGLMGMVELLQNSDLDTFEAEYADAAQESGRELMGMLNDILEYCRMDAGHVTFQPEHVTSQMIMDLLTEKFQKYGYSRTLAFEAKLGANVPENLVLDIEFLRRALRQLYDNAAKYAAGGKVELSVDVAGIGEGAELCITVSDDGPGIATDDLARVLEAFEKGHSNHGDGVGLGLTIVRRLTQMMGGSFTLTSELGQGTSASLHFPILQVTDSESLEKVMTESTQPRPARILVVEDNIVNQRVAVGFLKMISCEFETANNGLEAILRLSEEDFDLILMDCMMPEVDGYEATRRIRGGDSGESMMRIPIVALTADDSPDARQNCLRAGMDDYMTKPVRIERLRAMLRIWLPPGLRPAAE
jgi:signal transduction histidine kinase/ActR/RegA family two-component response regulator